MNKYVLCAALGLTSGIGASDKRITLPSLETMEERVVFLREERVVFLREDIKSSSLAVFADSSFKVKDLAYLFMLPFFLSQAKESRFSDAQQSFVSIALYNQEKCIIDEFIEATDCLLREHALKAKPSPSRTIKRIPKI